jgi:endonuclease G, mitochondrial
MKKNVKQKKKKKSKGLLLLSIFVLLLVLTSSIFWGLSSQKKKQLFQGSGITSSVNKPSQQSSLPNNKKHKASQEVKQTSAQPENIGSTAYQDHYYYTKSFDFAWPKYHTNDDIIEHTYFTLKYNEEHEQAEWVAYKLKREDLEKPKNKRKNNFRPDPKVATFSAHPKDYYKSGYDRGHLAPAGDFSWSVTAMDETFYMSNMSPQHPGLNRGIWKDLEEKIREWAKRDSELYIITGPVLKPGLKSIGKNKVSVPEIYYKVILDIQEPEIKGAGFLFYNEKTHKDLSEFIVTIDSVENLTGLDFFPSLPDSLEEAIESRKHKDLWFRK